MRCWVRRGRGRCAPRVSDRSLWHRSFIEAAEPARREPNLDDVVITGGSGGIAIHCVRALVARGARRIVLLSRRPIDPATLAALSGGQPTELVSVACDIRDETAVAAAADRFGAAGATLIIHAAGTAEFRCAAAPRCGNRRRYLRREGPGPGEPHPALAAARRHPNPVVLLGIRAVGRERARRGGAANRVLDVLAAQLRATGRDCSALRFGLWDAPSAIVDGPGRQHHPIGTAAHGPRLGGRRHARRPARRPLIYAADARRLGLFLDRQQVENPAQPATDAASVVRTELAAVLNLGAGTVDLGESLFDLGVDSLLALDLRKRLKGRLGRTVALATLLSGVTGNQIVSELEQQKVDHA